ncbi:MAG TPA: LiaF domain-containing protein, partial [Euzebya sp.]|nr:LiaF domain-containing protein [Euzebya sp.]
TIDLTGLQLDGESVDVVARMGAGELVIMVPEGADVQVRGTLQAGDYTVLGENRSGTGHAFNVSHEGEPGVGRIDLDISVLVGEVTVQTVERR